MAFIHTGKAQSNPLSRRLNIRWGDSMLRKRPGSYFYHHDANRFSPLRTRALTVLMILITIQWAWCWPDAQETQKLCLSRLEALNVLWSFKPIMHRFDLPLYYSQAWLCAYRPHTHPGQCRKGLNLHFRLLWHSPVWSGQKRGHLLSTKDFATFIWGAALSHY